MLKLFRPLKWALAESLVALSKSQNAFSSDQIEKTRIDLLWTCGIDPTRVPHEEVKRLQVKIQELEGIKKDYEQSIAILEQKFVKLAARKKPAKKETV